MQEEEDRIKMDQENLEKLRQEDEARRQKLLKEEQEKERIRLEQELIRAEQERIEFEKIKKMEELGKTFLEYDEQFNLAGINTLEDFFNSMGNNYEGTDYKTMYTDHLKSTRGVYNYLEKRFKTPKRQLCMTYLRGYLQLKLEEQKNNTIKPNFKVDRPYKKTKINVSTYYSITQSETNEHKHECNSCKVTYYHIHAGIENHKQFNYQCPNPNCKQYQAYDDIVRKTQYIDLYNGYCGYWVFLFYIAAYYQDNNVQLGLIKYILDNWDYFYHISGTNERIDDIFEILFSLEVNEDLNDYYYRIKNKNLRTNHLLETQTISNLIDFIQRKLKTNVLEFDEVTAHLKLVNTNDPDPIFVRIRNRDNYNLLSFKVYQKNVIVPWFSPGHYSLILL